MAPCKKEIIRLHSLDIISRKPVEVPEVKQYEAVFRRFKVMYLDHHIY